MYFIKVYSLIITIVIIVIRALILVILPDFLMLIITYLIIIYFATLSFIYSISIIPVIKLIINFINCSSL